MTDVAAIPDIVTRVRAGQQAGLLRSLDDRRAQLHALRRLLVEREADLTRALHADLRKPPLESYGTEIGFLLNEIDHALANLERWARPERVSIPLAFRPGRARIVPQPRGTVCIIAPWNYPVQLQLAPLVPALAAGNAAVLKPSEVTPTVAELLAELVPAHLDERLVAVVTGAVEETTALLEQPFDHIFFTGSGHVGRIVMRAAAEQLTPVTLELGGKSPVIITPDAAVEVAARRIAWAKFSNAGQTCVAPDHVLATPEVEGPLTEALAAAVRAFYGPDPQTSPDYPRIVNEQHHDRLTGLLDGGGYDRVVVGGEQDRDDLYVAPTVLAGVRADAAVMQEEIFGPILPVVGVADVDEAIRFVNERDHPLALYAFGEDDEQLARIVRHTTSGGVTLNHASLHVAVPELPFGGIGASGMGAYHGRAGFDVFSHRRSVLRKPTWPDPPLLYPPYTSIKEWVVRTFV